MADSADHPSTIQAAWIRRIRSNAKVWASDWEPVQDITLLSEVKESMFAWMLEEDPKSITMAFTSPIYAPVCLWAMVRVDVKDMFEKRGYTMYPSKIDIERGNGPRNTRWMVARNPIAQDDPAYIALVRDMLVVKIEQTERLAENVRGRIEVLNDRKAQYETWLRPARVKK